MAITALPLFGRRQRFERVVRQYSGELYAFACWLCRDRQLARDLVQETCLRAWRSWSTLRDEANVKSWLFTILRREFARTFERKTVPTADDDPATLDSASGFGMESALEVREALQALPESLREPLLLQVLGGFSSIEIAAMLDTTEGAVMTRLTRSRQAMRRLLDGAPSSTQESAR